MADFKTAFNKTVISEGGYSNNPNDNGGETYKGVARKFFPRWPGWPIIDNIKRANPGASEKTLTGLLKNNIELNGYVLYQFKTEFWDKMLLDQIKSQLLAEEMYDTGVNMGFNVAASFLQRSLNVLNKRATLYPDIAADGKMGPKTVNTANAYPDAEKLVRLLNALQGARYVSICENNPSQEVFMNGWLTRVMEQYKLK